MQNQFDKKHCRFTFVLLNFVFIRDYFYTSYLLIFRQLTQRWRFTEDGKLMCTHRGLYVQAKDGFSGLQLGECVAIKVRLLHKILLLSRFYGL